MREMLTSDPSEADALLDMSNVLRNTSLGGDGPADLSRLTRTGQALAALYGAKTIAMFGVADRSLLAQPGLFLDPRQRHDLRSWAEAGLILVTAKADIPLLQIAAETGLPVITSDRFVGHRREFPWLDGSDDAVLEPQADGYGRVVLRHVKLNRHVDWEMSMSEERDLLVQQGLSRRVEALGRYWGCPDARCPRHKPKNSAFILLPVANGDRLVCDQHGLEMVDLGPRPRVAQLKIMFNGLERRRLTVAQDVPLMIGRSPGPADLSSFLDETTRRRVSRTHLRFDLDADRLTVTDLSLNGTVLILRDGTRVDLRRAMHSFTVGDRVQIQPSLEIIRSGRRYPAELPIGRAPQRPSEPPASTIGMTTEPEL
jgi:hypothetical protein